MNIQSIEAKLIKNKSGCMTVHRAAQGEGFVELTSKTAVQVLAGPWPQKFKYSIDGLGFQNTLEFRQNVLAIFL